MFTQHTAFWYKVRQEIADFYVTMTYEVESKSNLNFSIKRQRL